MFQGTKNEFHPIFYFCMKELDAYTHKWTMPRQTFEKKFQAWKVLWEFVQGVLCVQKFVRGRESMRASKNTSKEKCVRLWEHEKSIGMRVFFPRTNENLCIYPREFKNSSRKYIHVFLQNTSISMAIMVAFWWRTWFIVCWGT